MITRKYSNDFLEFGEKLNQVIDLMRSQKEEDKEKARNLLFPYILHSGIYDFDYSLYCTEYILQFAEEFMDPRKIKYGITYYGVIYRIFDFAKKNNLQQYKELIINNWNYRDQVANQIINSQTSLEFLRNMAEYFQQSANKEETKDLIQKICINDPQGQVLSNSYKDLYEIDYALNTLANLIKIVKGEVYTERPFSLIKVNNKPICNKHGFLFKNSAIEWLLKESYRPLKILINRSYNCKMRNILGGHNKFMFDSLKKEYLSFDNSIKYSFETVATYRYNLFLLIKCLMLESNTRYYEDILIDFPMSEVGIVSWDWGENGNEINLFQNWANFNLRRTKKIDIKEIGFYPSLTKSKKGENLISIGLNNYYKFPYDCCSKFNDIDKQRIKDVENKMVKVNIYSLAPNIEPFNYNLVNNSDRSKDKTLIVGKDTYSAKVMVVNPEVLFN